MNAFSLVLELLLCFSNIFAATSIRTARAKKHIGESTVVCGKVVEIVYFETISYLSLDRPYLQKIFLVGMSESVGFTFAAVSRSYFDKRVCVSGRVENHSGTPEIIVTGDGHIQIRSK